jgi:hypothetical protein
VGHSEAKEQNAEEQKRITSRDRGCKDEREETWYLDPENLLSKNLQTS